MTEIFRRRVITFLVDRKLLDEHFAYNLMSWKYSGFSINNGVCILDHHTQANLAEHIARPPSSLKKIRYEPFKGRVLFHTTYPQYFKENMHLFDALDFLAELTQHLPPKGVQLIRRYGLYSSRTKGRWSDMPHVVQRAPAGWIKAHSESVHDHEILSIELLDDTVEVELTQRKQAWALLLAKSYKVDPFVCPKCVSAMLVVAATRGSRRDPPEPSPSRKDRTVASRG